MLEYVELLIQGCDQKGRRPILGGSVLQEVGFAQTGIASSTLAKLFSQFRLAIHESGDEPLLFTMRKGWCLSAWHDVLEAEDQKVGSVCRSAIRMGTRTNWASIQKKSCGKTRITNLESSPLAEFQSDSRGTSLCFDPSIQGEPYLKMLLLAAVLLNTQ